MFKFGLNFSGFRSGTRGLKVCRVPKGATLVRQKDPTTVALFETHHAKIGLVVALRHGSGQALRVPCAVRLFLRSCSGQVLRWRKLAALRQCAVVFPRLAARLGHFKGQGNEKGEKFLKFHWCEEKLFGTM